MITEVKRAILIDESLHQINQDIVRRATEIWDRGETNVHDWRLWVAFFAFHEWDRIVREN